MTGRFRILVADDEPLARERLRMLLTPCSEYEIVRECIDGNDALASIRREQPDLVFLDIRMPGLSGIEVAQAALDLERPPLIVFVTAFDEFALRAFDVSAVDYVVKPVDIDRFDRTLERVGDRLRGSAVRPAIDDVRLLLDDLRAGPGFAKRFLVRSPRGHYFVKTQDIETATAEGNYVALSAAGRVHLIRHTMQAFEAVMDPTQFIRIHRSTIVNIDRIERIEPLGHSEYRVTMKNGARFQSSRAYCHRFRSLG